MTTQTTSLILPNSIRVNSAYSFSGMIVYMACQWGMICVLTKTVPKADVGYFFLALALTSPLIEFFGMGVGQVYITDSRGDLPLRDCLGHRLIACSIVAILSPLIAIILGFTEKAILVVACIALAKASEAFSNIFYSVCQKHERMDYVFLMRSLKGVFSVIVFSLVAYCTHNIVFVVLSLFLTWFILVFLLDISVSSRLVLNYLDDFRPRFHFGTIWKISATSVVFGISQMISATNSSIPRFFVARFQGPGTLAVFGSLAYFSVIGNAVVGSTAKAVLPRLSQCYAEGRLNEARALRSKLFLVGIATGTCAVLVSCLGNNFILSHAYSSEYAQYGGVLVLLMVGLLVACINIGLRFTLTSLRAFRVIMCTDTCYALTLVICCSVLVPRYALYGGAYSIIISASVYAIFAAVSIRHVEQSLGPLVLQNPMKLRDQG